MSNKTINHVYLFVDMDGTLCDKSTRPLLFSSELEDMQPIK